MFHVKHFGTIGAENLTKRSYVAQPWDMWDCAENWYCWRLHGAAARCASDTGTQLALRNRRNDRFHYRLTNDGGSGAPANQHRQTVTIQATASVVIQHLRQKRLSRQAERGCRLV
jgi:hypothetical protein